MHRAGELIARNIPTLTRETPVNEALYLMDEWGVTDLPMLENGKYLGLASESNFLDLQEMEADTLVEMQVSPVSVLPTAHTLDILSVASKHAISVVPVVDAKENYIGSVRTDELLAEISQMLGAHVDGGVLVLHLAERDHSISQIARIIEENGAKILSLSVSPMPEGDLEMCVKIDRPDLNAIVQSLKRFNYRVVEQIQDSQFDEDIRNRYDELMRFLNM